VIECAEMVSDTFVDSKIKTVFCESWEAAHGRATREAANCTGQVVEVESVEVGARTVFVGRVPRSALVREESGGSGRLRLDDKTGTTLYTTWGSLVTPATPRLGFLVLRHPLRVTGAMPPAAEEEETARVAVGVRRYAKTVGNCVLGKQLCTNCNGEISSARLAVKPGARFCTSCASKREAR
jgi:hypothetical protein